jgi:hypothetical protein
MGVFTERTVAFQAFRWPWLAALKVDRWSLNIRFPPAGNAVIFVMRRSAEAARANAICKLSSFVSGSVASHQSWSHSRIALPTLSDDFSRMGPLGGWRPWFQCPCCKRRVGKLYSAGLRCARAECTSGLMRDYAIGANNSSEDCAKVGLQGARSIIPFWFPNDLEA